MKLIEEMMVMPADSLQSLIERAIDTAREKGVTQQFRFNRKVYRSDPQPAGTGVVYEVTDESRRPTEVDEAILYIGLCSKMMPKRWSVSGVVSSFMAGNQVLVAGRNTGWLELIWQETRNQVSKKLDLVMGSDVGSRSLITTTRTFELQDAGAFKGRIRFETYRLPQSFQGCTF